jgi:N6-adenosine-specific RNA methylase IME4
MKYKIIYADPPWTFKRCLANGNKNNKIVNLKQVRLSEKYDTMSIQDICNLPVKDICDDDCILFMWTTDAHLEESFRVINAWGFKYRTVAFDWLKKTKQGVQVCYVGSWTLKGSEICLLATKGRMQKYLKKRNVRKIVEAPCGRHSEKPQEVRNRIVEMFGNELFKIELFARQKVEGWDSWGNEIESDIIL